MYKVIQRFKDKNKKEMADQNKKHLLPQTECFLKILLTRKKKLKNIHNFG